MKTLIWKDTSTPIFTVALFTIAKTWEQPKCPLTDWMDKEDVIYIYIYMYIYIFNIQKTKIIHTHTHTEWNIIQPLSKNESLSFAYHTNEISQAEKVKNMISLYHHHSHLCINWITLLYIWITQLSLHKAEQVDFLSHGIPYKLSPKIARKDGQPCLSL